MSPAPRIPATATALALLLACGVAGAQTGPSIFTCTAPSGRVITSDRLIAECGAFLRSGFGV